MNQRTFVAVCCATLALSAVGVTYADSITTFSQLKNPSSGACLDSLGRAGTAGMYACHGKKGNQEWTFEAGKGELKNPSTGMCLDSFGKDHAIMVAACHGKGGNQAWIWDASRGELRNPSSGQCVDSLGKTTGELKMYNCHGKQGNQEWR
jgi:polypeptide N-acetylgalactosaminyltransferase